MRRVYKWPWPGDARRGPVGHLTLPWSALDRVLLVDDQNGILTLWCDQEDEAVDPAQRRFDVVGTGGRVPAGHQHVGSAVVGDYVWHVYAAPFDVPF